MAHFGSAWVTSVKAFSAAAYWNEWSCAIPYKNEDWAAWAHELGKWILPSPPEEDAPSGCCARQGAIASETSKTSTDL